ncbi:hypothetical protein ROZALSC1DRAFT_20936, partial [Rozella allomycis CSF55]
MLFVIKAAKNSSVIKDTVVKTLEEFEFKYFLSSRTTSLKRNYTNMNCLDEILAAEKDTAFVVLPTGVLVDPINYNGQSTVAKKLSRREILSKTYSNYDFDRPNPSGNEVLMCPLASHSAPQILFEPNGKTISNKKGYCVAKSTHGFDYGDLVYEVHLPVDFQGHVRIGWSHILGDPQAG